MIVGEAHVIVRAITTGVDRDIKNAFRDSDRWGDDAGRDFGRGMSRGIGDSLGSQGGGGGIFQGIAAAAEGARGQFDSLIRVTYTLGPALAVLAGALGALAGGFVALSGTVAGAIPSLLALPGIFVAVATAALTLKLAFSGVGEAISAGLRSGGASGAAAAVERDLTSFYRRVQDAKENLRRVVEESNRRIADAERTLAGAKAKYAQDMADADARISEARQRYERVVRDGVERVSDAQNRLRDVEERSARDISKAKRRVEEAQRNLNKAYEDGREELQQMNFAAEDAVLAEKRAALELEKARERLLRVQDLPPNSRARKEAELAFAQADLNYRKAMDTNADMAKEQERLNREGVDGTKAVVQAKKTLADAVENQYETEERAIKDVEKARLDLARTQRDADEAAARAKDAIAKAEEDKARREVAALERIADAERNLEKVIIQRLEAEYDAELQLKRAVEDLAKAKKKGYGAASGGASAYQNALSKLSKEQRQFVQYMVKTFIPSLDRLKAAAGRKFFPQLIEALENLRTRLFPALEPLLERTGDLLGKIAKDFSETLTSDESIRQIEKIWGASDNVLADLGEVAQNALRGFFNLLEASIPLVERFTGWLVKISERFAAWLDTEGKRNSFTEFLQKSGDIAAILGKTLGDVFGGFGNIVKQQIEPGSGGYMLLTFFSDAAAKFKEFTEVNTDRMGEFFTNTANNSKSILSFIGAFVKEILKLGENPNVGVFFDKLKDLAPTMGELGNKLIDAGPALADFVRSFVDFANATLESGAIDVFWETLTGIFDALTTVFENPIMQQVLTIVGRLAAAGVALRTAWMLLRIPILGIIEPVTKVVGGFGKLSGKIDDLKKAKEAKEPLSGLQRALVGIGGLGSGPIALIIAGIAGLVLAFVAMWNESEIFRKAIKDLVDGALTRAQEMFDRLKQKLDAALEPLGGLEGGLDALKAVFKFLGDILGTYVIPVIDDFIQNYLKILEVVLGTIIDIIGYVIEKFMAVKDLFAAGDFFGGFIELVKSLVLLIPNLFMKLIQNILSIFGISSPSKIFSDIGQSIIDGLMLVLKTIVAIVTAPFKLLIAGIKAIFNLFMDWWNNTLWPLIQAGIDLIKGGFDLLKSGIAAAWDGIKSAISAVGDWFKNTLWPIIEGVINIIKGGFELQKTAIETAWNGIKTAVNAVAGWFRDTLVPILTGVWDGIKTAVDTVKTKVQSAFRGIRSVVETVAGAVKTALSGLWSGLSAGLAAAVSAVRRTLRPALQFIVDKVNVLRRIPAVAALLPSLTMPAWMVGAGAEGAIVTRPTLALIGEAGPEALIPLHKMPGNSPVPDLSNVKGGQMGGADITVNVYPSPGMDEIELASMVSREIAFMMRKGAA